jgi:hypothetical protein
MCSRCVHYGLFDERRSGRSLAPLFLVQMNKATQGANKTRRAAARAGVVGGHRMLAVNPAARATTSTARDTSTASPVADHQKSRSAINRIRALT